LEIEEQVAGYACEIHRTRHRKGHDHAQPGEGQDPHEPPDQKVPNVVVSNKQLSDQKAREGEEYRHPSRGNRLIQPPSLGPQRQKMGAEHQENAQGTPAIELRNVLRCACRRDCD
jgi:hypothetical protein